MENSPGVSIFTFKIKAILLENRLLVHFQTTSLSLSLSTLVLSPVHTKWERGRCNSVSDSGNLKEMYQVKSNVTFTLTGDQYIKKFAIIQGVH